MVDARVRALTVLSTAIALLALGATGSAVAAPTTLPSGTPKSTASQSVILSADQITKEADFLSGRALTVTCGTSAASWAQSLQAVALPAINGAEFYGFSVIAAGEMHLSPYVCEGLRLGANRRSRDLNELQVGWSVDVLVHESAHLGRFTNDEAVAEACARAGLPGELHRLYGLGYHTAEMSALTLAATWFRRSQDASYQGGACPLRV